MRLDHLLSRETYTEPRAWMSLRSTLWRLTLFGFERSVKTLKHNMNMSQDVVRLLFFENCIEDNYDIFVRSSLRISK